MNNFTPETAAAATNVHPEAPKYKLGNLIIMFFIFAFSGWIWEVIYIGFTDGVIAKRGMLHGPWLPIYGVGGILILLLLSRFHGHPTMVFVLALLLCGTMEYSAAVAIELIFRCRWWDYSDKFMNLNGRICLEGLLLFGFSGALAVCKVGPALDEAVNRLSRRLHGVVCVALCMFFAIDLIFSFHFPNIGVGVTYALLS